MRPPSSGWQDGSLFRNWIDIARLDPAGPGSRTLAELIAWQALSKSFLETPDGVAAIDTIQQILRDSNSVEVFTAACEAMCEMDIEAGCRRSPHRLSYSAATKI